MGTDGYGRSDTENLRDFFEVNAKYICLYAINALINEGKIENQLDRKLQKYQIMPIKKYHVIIRNCFILLFLFSCDINPKIKMFIPLKKTLIFSRIYNY